jgi:hypothetical protein
VPGYVLLLPQRHTQSFSDLNDSEWIGVGEAIEAIRCAYQRAGHHDISIFEHGCATGRSSVGCIDHAHWHVIPVNFEPPAELSWHRYGAMSDVCVSGLLKREYLLLCNKDGWFVAEQVPSRQFLRRQLAAQIGLTDEWDYVAFPHEENIRLTLSMFVDAHGDD